MNILKNSQGSQEDPTNTFTDFWNWFQQNESTFYPIIKDFGLDLEVVEYGFIDPVIDKLNEYKDGIFMLTGMFDETVAEIIFSADGDVKNIGFIKELVAAAPKMDKWRITALKPANGVADISLKLEDFEFNKDSIFFYANDNEQYPDLIDLSIVFDEFHEEELDLVTRGIFIFLDHCLGEEKFADVIDEMEIIPKSKAKKALIPVEKLNDFIAWREKEFIEKYEGIRHNTENEHFSLMQAQLENGSPLMALINTETLSWDCKASHPWILIIEVKFDGSLTNGMPNKTDFVLLNDLEIELVGLLKSADGYLNIGRQTCEGTREIYFTCKEYSKASKIVFQFINKYADQFEFDYQIYKDKYWMCMDRFLPEESV